MENLITEYEILVNFIDDEIFPINTNIKKRTINDSNEIKNKYFKNNGLLHNGSHKNITAGNSFEGSYLDTHNITAGNNLTITDSKCHDIRSDNNTKISKTNCNNVNTGNNITISNSNCDNISAGNKATISKVCCNVISVGDTANLTNVTCNYVDATKINLHETIVQNDVTTCAIKGLIHSEIKGKLNCVLSLNHIKLVVDNSIVNTIIVEDIKSSTNNSTPNYSATIKITPNSTVNDIIFKTKNKGIVIVENGGKLTGTVKNGETEYK